MACKGRPPKKLLKKGLFSSKHFDLTDPNCSFVGEDNKVGGVGSGRG